MKTPDLKTLAWGDIISIVAWLCVVIYTASVLRADVQNIQKLVIDHEQRIRTVEAVGSSSLAAHKIDAERRTSALEADLKTQREHLQLMKDTLVRIDTNVSLLLSERQKDDHK